jgi:hypothetical protein
VLRCTEVPDSAPCWGPCGKPPSGLYVESGEESALLAFTFYRPPDQIVRKPWRAAIRLTPDSGA